MTDILILTLLVVLLGLAGVVLGQVRISRKLMRTRFERTEERLDRIERKLDRVEVKTGRPAMSVEPPIGSSREENFESIRRNVELIRERVLGLTANLGPAQFDGGSAARIQRIRKLSRATSTTRTLVEVGEFDDEITESVKKHFHDFVKLETSLPAASLKALTKPAYFRVNFRDLGSDGCVELLEAVQRARPWGHVFGFEGVEDAAFVERLSAFTETTWPGAVVSSGSHYEFIADGTKG